MRTSAPGLLPLFRSEAQLAILGALFVGGDRSWTITGLAEHLDLPVSTAAREVGRLDDAGIVTVTTQGRNKMVGANWDLPWAGALASLLDQTIGPMSLLGDALAGLPGLQEAWIFGSWSARHSGRIGPAPRDIDLLLVGDDVSRFDIANAIDAVPERVGVEVNPYVVTVDEWREPTSDSFVAEIKAGPLVEVPLRSDANA